MSGPTEARCRAAGGVASRRLLDHDVVSSQASCWYGADVQGISSDARAMDHTENMVAYKGMDGGNAALGR